ncbi:MAG TPA: HPP family protein [Geobacteraceae bacterium]
MVRRRLMQFPGRIRGTVLFGEKEPLSLKYACWGFLSGTAGILAIRAVTGMAGHSLLIAPMAASAVLLFGANESPLAQPRNLVGGHLVAAGLAVLIVAMGGSGPLAMALAVGCAILLMDLTRTTHPPAGATAFIGVQGHAGPLFIVVPVLGGALILLLVALFTNNVVYHRRYPRHWL